MLMIFLGKPELRAFEPEKTGVQEYTKKCYLEKKKKKDKDVEAEREGEREKNSTVNILIF